MLSILICTRDRPQHIRQCLQNIAQADLASVQEVLVLDQSDTPTDLRDAGLPEHLLRYEWRPGRGLARARNQAVRLARSALIAFTDDDCLITPAWPAQIVRTFADYPDVAAVYGRVLPYDDGSAPVTCHAYKTAFGSIAYATRPGGMVCGALIDNREFKLIDQPVMPIENVGSGNNMAFRRTTFLRHGLFIEGLGTGTRLYAGEDVEFHIRLMHARRLLAYNPAALVYHNSWSGPEKQMRQEDGYAIGMIAVMLGLALTGEPLGSAYLRARFGSVAAEASTAVREQETRRPRSYYVNRALAFAKGILGGLWLAAFYRRLIPRLNKTTEVVREGEDQGGRSPP